MEVEDALRALGGAARWKRLRGHVSWRAVKRARARGTVEVLGSLYVLADTERPLQLAAERRGTRSHTTAAEHWGLALPPDQGVIHLTVPPNAHRDKPPGDVRLHYRSVSDQERLEGVTSPLRTVVDCLRDCSLQVALCVGDSALREGALTWEELQTAVGELRGKGSATARRRADQLDARAANAFESSMRALLLEAGIDGFEPQVDIRHDRTFVGRVDLAHRRRRIVIECDGFEFHGTREGFDRDLVRFTMLVAGGWRPLRFTWTQVMMAASWVLARVQDVLDLTGAAMEESRRRPRSARCTRSA